jgi:hypothetical protein
MEKFLAAALYLFCMCVASSAQDMRRAKLTVEAENVEMHYSPGAKSPVIKSEWMDGSFFIVEYPPAKDKEDGSEWLKILFFVSPLGDSFIQVHKLEDFKFAYPYVSAQFVETSPLWESDYEELDYLKRGRPPGIAIGEKIEGLGGYICEVLSPIALCKEPKAGAGKITIPFGEKILVPEGDAHIYSDVDEVSWFFLLDERQCVLGWIKSKDWDSMKSSLKATGEGVYPE